MIVKVIKIAAMVLIFTGLIGASAYLTLTLLIKSEDTVVVPDLAGQDVVYALEVISDLGLHIKVIGSDFSDRVPKSHVLSQNKPPGKRSANKVVAKKGPAKKGAAKKQPAKKRPATRRSPTKKSLPKSTTRGKKGGDHGHAG